MNPNLYKLAEQLTVIYDALPQHGWSFKGRKVKDLTLRPRRVKITKERKMRVVTSTWSNSMAACNTITCKREQWRK